MEQASAVATEVTSSIVRLKLEVEEKKRAISLLQTALVGGSAPPARWGAKEQSPQHPFPGAEAPGGTALRVGVPIHPPAGSSPAVPPELSGELWGRGVLGHAVVLVFVSMGRVLEVLPHPVGSLRAPSRFGNHLSRCLGSAQRGAVLNFFLSSTSGGLGGPADSRVGDLGDQGLGLAARGELTQQGLPFLAPTRPSRGN